MENNLKGIIESKESDFFKFQPTKEFYEKTQVNKNILPLCIAAIIRSATYDR